MSTDTDSYDNSEEHEITAIEPCCVTKLMKLDDGGMLVTEETVNFSRDTKSYICSCGKTFNTFEQAEEHVREAKEI